MKLDAEQLLEEMRPTEGLPPEKLELLALQIWMEHQRRVRLIRFWTVNVLIAVIVIIMLLIRR
jgi:hypothetical protein